MGYNTVAVLYNDHTHLIREDRDIGRRIAEAMQSWHVRDRYPLALDFGCGTICSQEHADYSQVVVVGQNRGRRLCDCDDLDGYTLDQLADALRRHGWTVKEPGRKKQTAQNAKDDPHARIYPCVDCGIMRSKAEGGTTFTVCDECWNKRNKK